MTELAPAEMALRVGVFAGALGVVGWLPGNLQTLAVGVLVIVALFALYEIWAARGSRRRQRSALILAVAALVSAWLLNAGWAAYVSTPLLALGAVCVALWFAGTLGRSDDDDVSEETLH